MAEVKKRYTVSFSGDLKEGTNVEEVKAKASSAFNMPEQMIKRLLTVDNQPVVVKKVNSLELANQWQKKFLELGMLLDIDEEVIEEVSRHQLNELKAKKERKRLKKDNVAEKKSVSNNENATKHSPIHEFIYITRVIICGILAVTSLGLIVLYMPFPDFAIKRGMIIGVFMLIGAIAFARSTYKYHHS